MRRRPLLAAALVLAVGAVAAWLLGSVASPSSASSLARGGLGMFAARRYVETSGTEVRLLDRPLRDRPAFDTLVVAFPTSIGFDAGELRVLNTFLRRGGRLLVAVSGDVPSLAERQLLTDLGLETDAVRGAPPLTPQRWREWVDARWRLVPVDGEGPAVAVPAPRRLPRAPRGAEAWYRNESGTAVIFAFAVGEGQVVVLPRDALANHAIARSGNADLLASLIASREGAWAFDEYRHGLVAAGVQAGRAESVRAFDLLLLHGVLVYLGAVLALSRRFGQRWHDPEMLKGSTASFLRSLGLLHHRLRHHRDAARAMLARARELDPRFGDEPELDSQVAQLEPSQFVSFARAVAARQQRVGGSLERREAGQNRASVVADRTRT